VATVKQQVQAYLAKETSIELEYFEVADAESLQPIETWPYEQEVALCLAVWLAGVRLIDNIIVNRRS
jgi:pantoate--beta-alanine ligase